MHLGVVSVSLISVFHILIFIILTLLNYYLFNSFCKSAQTIKHKYLNLVLNIIREIIFLVYYLYFPN